MAKKREIKKTNNTAMWIMFSPYLFLLVAFGLIPIVMAALEVPHESRVNPDGGWDAFMIVLQDFRLWPAVRNVLGFMAMFVPGTIAFVILMSLLLDVSPKPWKKFLRMAYIVPAAISGAVAVLVWYAILQPAFSPIKQPLAWFGITTSDQIWQTSKLVYIFAVMAFFAIAGNWILIQYGSLQSISHEILEAARVDGCSAFQVAIRIKLPMIKKYIVYMGVLIFAGGLQLFVEPQLINIGIYSGIAESWSIDQLAFELAFTSGDFGGASALALILLVPSFLGALLVIFKTDMFEEAVIEKNEKLEA
jgi:multiple sugar transport system permease protein